MNYEDSIKSVVPSQRLMLGTPGNPSLLVHRAASPELFRFDFEVINGGWRGTYFDGNITVWGGPSGDWSSLEKMEVICADQNRLRGNYEDVFANFHDVYYIAPQPKPIPEYWDDDISF